VRNAVSEAPKRSKMAKLITLMTAKGMFSRYRTFASNQSVIEMTFETAWNRQPARKKVVSSFQGGTLSSGADPPNNFGKNVAIPVGCRVDRASSERN
jgi:hypothetical protein